MKYMGSKRVLLLNGLNDVLRRSIADRQRFVDLFAGSGAVAAHVAQQYDIEVRAYDLQEFSGILVRAVLERVDVLDSTVLWKRWNRAAEKICARLSVPKNGAVSRRSVVAVRNWAQECEGWPVTRAYGGHYFSAEQSVWIDALRRTVPRDHQPRTVAVAALIRGASRCVAAPGHTAQPFQPTPSAMRFLAEAWRRNVVNNVKAEFDALCAVHAKRRGRAEVADANIAATTLRQGDLAFIDPPYSGVHYSRFYHVLETIALGKDVQVCGTGRYPPPEQRPRSRYSLRSESLAAIQELLSTVAECGASAIVTFPNHDCSNGLSGEKIKETAREYFTVRETIVKSKLSTLGGRGNNSQAEAGRSARLNAEELIFVLTPKKSRRRSIMTRKRRCRMHSR